MWRLSGVCCAPAPLLEFRLSLGHAQFALNFCFLAQSLRRRHAVGTAAIKGISCQTPPRDLVFPLSKEPAVGGGMSQRTKMTQSGRGALI
jgi:hypothetical protein